MFESRLSDLLRAAHRHRVAVLAGTALIALVSFRSLSSLSFDSNVFNLLPQGGPAVRSFLTYLNAFGTLDRLYIVFEAPADQFVSDYATFIDAYVEELRGAPEIQSVDAGPADVGEDWGYVLDRQLLLLGAERAREVLARFSPDGLRRELAHTREMLTVPSADLRALVQQDPLGLLPLLRERIGAEAAGLNIDPTRAGYITPDGRSQLVIVKPSRPPFDTAFCRALMQRLEIIKTRIRDAAPGSPASGPTSLTIQAAGAYRVALETEDLIREEGTRTALVSLVSVLTLVYLVFRSGRILLAAAIPLVLAAVVTLALNGLWWQLSAAASGCAAMLFGVGVDGVVLLYVRYLEERGRGLGTEEAIGNLSTTVVSMLLGFTTTAATYFGLMPVDFPSLQEVGRLIGTSILVSGVLAIVIVPALLPRTLSARQARPLEAVWLGRIVQSYRHTILWSAVAATVLLGIASAHLRVVPTLQKLQPQTAATEVERAIFRRFSVPDDVVLMLGEGGDLDALIDGNAAAMDRIRDRASHVRVTSVVSFIPPRTDQEAVRRVIRESGLTVDRARDLFVRAASQAGFRPEAFSPFLERLPRLLDPDQSIGYAGFRELGLTDLIDRYVAATPNGYVTVAYAYPREPGELASVEAALTGSGQNIQLTGITLVNRELSAAFMPQFLLGGTIGSTAVVILIFMGFRTVRRTMLSVVPTAIGLVWTVGVLALARVELDLFSVFSLLMCIGIGVDYSIHVLHRHAAAPTGSITEPLVKVAPAMLLAWATTTIGFGTLAASSYGPLRSLAMVSVVTLLCCLVTSLLVLPAALLAWDGPDGTAATSGNIVAAPRRT